MSTTLRPAPTSRPTAGAPWTASRPTTPRPQSRTQSTTVAGTTNRLGSLEIATFGILRRSGRRGTNAVGVQRLQLGSGAADGATPRSGGGVPSRTRALRARRNLRPRATRESWGSHVHLLGGLEHRRPLRSRPARNRAPMGPACTLIGVSPGCDPAQRAAEPVRSWENLPAAVSRSARRPAGPPARARS